MTCSKFKEQAQNKRYLGDLLNKMLRAAKDQSESFEDIPLDTRHVQARLKKKKSMYPDFKFPADWKRPQDAPKQPEDVISSLENLASLSNAQ